MTGLNYFLTTAFTLASVGTNYLLDRMECDTFEKIGKKMMGLREDRRYREAAFFDALTRTVDDPNTTQDIHDSDSDGIIDEEVPVFQYWWDLRIKELKGMYSSLLPRIEEFVYGPLTAFHDSAEKQINHYPPPRGNLCRQEILVEHFDGAVVELARALETAGQDVSFFLPGRPPPIDPDCECDPLHGDCSACGPEEYYDEIEAVKGELNRFDEVADILREKPSHVLASTWEDWILLFYDNDNKRHRPGDDDFYDTFQVIMNGDGVFQGLQAWKNEIEQKRLVLPACTYTYDPVTGEAISITNPPCKEWDFGSIDADLDDEFNYVQNELSDLIADIEVFRGEILDFYNDMSAMASVITGKYKENPVTYEWEDSRGKHSITVQAGPFVIPYIRYHKDGNFLKYEKCYTLTNYQDDGSLTWIKINRRDPDSKDVSSGGFISGWFGLGSVIRKSHVGYSFNYVAITRTSKE